MPMQDFICSVRRSLVFKPSAGGADDDGGGGFGGIVEKIGSSIRKSRIGLLSKPPLPALPPPIARSDMVRAKRKEKEDASPPVRWRKGELIGCGAFGRVYMGMNLDSGELLAIKQVSIAANSASKEKTQAHIRELEEEVNLLKNLSHPNIVRYLGTAREEESLNILLEFVPGGSISSLLGKFGSFPESATMTGAKSMKGTPYWMAPEVILQTGHSFFHKFPQVSTISYHVRINGWNLPSLELTRTHGLVDSEALDVYCPELFKNESFSADIWSVGCTVIEMATGKPPWSQQYQEVAALFHIGTTKSHPPIPDHLSVEAKDFLLKCLQKEPNFRAAAAVLLQHPFVMGQYQETDPVSRASVMGGVTENSGKRMATPEMEFKTSTTYTRLNDVHNSVRCSTIYPDKFSRNSPLWASNNRDDDMCQMDDDLVFGSSTKFDSPLLSDDFNKSFNPMSEPNDDWPCKFDGSPEIDKSGVNSFSGQTVNKAADSTVSYCNVDNDFTFPSEPSVAEDDDDVTETKIIAFLEEKAIDLKKLQTPLYEEFYNSLNASCSPNALGTENKENVSNNLCLPPKSRSPKRVSSRRFSAAIDVAYTASSGSQSQHLSNIGVEADQTLPQVQQPKPSEWKERMIDAQQELISPSASFSERQRRWEEELHEELERKRGKCNVPCY
ncbi:hypothetical protein RHGRI_012345 [Rhododendron griersonianum]|uniref:mitogen-activated protein kinase kinase kinase n=1 Tax=Rhododendron griersonianum TaxID=479676 RepID=A0AAV6KQ21_9ERIC|nr:hypothetical protein RHGRI_012345 [Rhododendron griersonianum]